MYAQRLFIANKRSQGEFFKCLVFDADTDSFTNDDALDLWLRLEKMPPSGEGLGDKGFQHADLFSLGLIGLDDP